MEIQAVISGPQRLLSCVCFRMTFMLACLYVLKPSDEAVRSDASYEYDDATAVALLQRRHVQSMLDS